MHRECTTGSAYGGAWGNGFVGLEDDDLAKLGVFLDGGGQQHAIGLLATDGARLEVGDDDDLAADEGGGVVEGADSSEDLALLAATQVDLELEEAVGVGVRFGGDDGGDAEIQLGEIVVGDERLVVH